MTLAGFWILLTLLPIQIYGFGDRGNCDYLYNRTLKLVCHSVVPEDVYKLYHDLRAPPNTPYSVWQSDVTDGSQDKMVLVSFFDNYLHNFDTMEVQNKSSLASEHSFRMRSLKRIRVITIRPSLLYCFAVSLRYPMELRSFCLGIGRSSDIAAQPVLHYAMDDIKVRKKSNAGASTFNPTLLIIVFSILFVVVIL